MGRRVDETSPKLQRILDHRNGAWTPMSPWVMSGSLPNARELKYSAYEFLHLLPNNFRRCNYRIQTPNLAPTHNWPEDHFGAKTASTDLIMY